MYAPNSLYEILTPLGFRSFRGMQCIHRETIQVFADGVCLLEGSARHPVLTPKGYRILEDLSVGQRICTKTGTVRIDRIQAGPVQSLFDPIEVDHPDRAYFTNDTISHNCSFQGSANTLIPAHKLAMLGYKDPVEKKGDLLVYTKPVRASDDGPAHVYQITVDIGMGQNLDYSVINVTDLSENPFRQVAVWRNNQLSATMLAPIIRDIGNYYNQAFVLMEINLEGHAVAEMLHTELEYANVMTVTPHPKKGQLLSGGFGLKSRFGLKMTEATKRIGCSGLKTLFEQDKYIVNDYQTLQELSRFIVVNNSYEAEAGNNDDIVMTLVLLGWLTLQLGFENYVGISMRRLLMEKQEPLTFDLPALGHLGDLEQTSVLGTTQGGVEIVDDADFWKDSPDNSWLN